MSVRRTLVACVLAAAPVIGPAVVAAPADAGTRWDNCTNLHNHWPHGVGRKHAVDHTSGTPVTNFKHSNYLYEKAMNHNSGLDRDKDKIACEAH